MTECDWCGEEMLNGVEFHDHRRDEHLTMHAHCKVEAEDRDRKWRASHWSMQDQREWNLLKKKVDLDRAKGRI
jgi:hypothetical protein